MRGEWRVDDERQSLVLAADGGLPEVVYWGAPLPADEDLGLLAAAARPDLTGGMLDRLAALSLCPGSGADTWQGKSGITLVDTSGRPVAPRLALESVDAIDGGIRLRSSGGGITLEHEVRSAGHGVLALSTRLQSDAPVRCLWLAAPVLPVSQASDALHDLSGKWIGEFRWNRTEWIPGIREREARTGRSGHEHPPFAMVTEAGTTATSGRAYGYSYAWSGGHRMVAEELPDGRRQIQFGHPVGAERELGNHFETGVLYVALTDEGTGGLARTWQRFTRDAVVRWPSPTRDRPVHYNCWEAVYFDHDLDTLTEIAARAARLGAERFVLDDGWFGRRDDDTSSLGDWTVDARKWPRGLGPLIERVHGFGMTFGLWVEPEMVNRDSDLYRAHPEWILGPADQVTGRNQLVLDIGKADVRDHLFKALDAILLENDIDYLKWDHNRLLPLVDAAQVKGLYDLLDRLRAAHPGVEIESCASGGGRIDLGILARTQRVWLSDSNDAIERLRIQHGAAFLLPSCITGSHVGPRVCHTSGRVLPMAFRAWVAAQRHMGFEMDLRELDDEEAAVLARVTAWYRENRTWMMAGDLLPLETTDPAVVAEVQVARDKGRFVLFAGQSETSAQILPRPVRLAGLEPAAHYRLCLVNADDAPRHSRGPCALKEGPLTLSGRALMDSGLHLPVAWPATMWVVEGTRL